MHIVFHLSIETPRVRRAPGFPTLHLQVEDDFIRAPVVVGNAAVVARVLGLDRADDEAAVAEEAPTPINRHQAGCPVTASQEEECTD